MPSCAERGFGHVSVYLLGSCLHADGLFSFLLTSMGLGLNCRLPVILTAAFVVHCLTLGRFTEVISAKAAKQNVRAVPVQVAEQDVSAV